MSKHLYTYNLVKSTLIKYAIGLNMKLLHIRFYYYSFHEGFRRKYIDLAKTTSYKSENTICHAIFNLI